MVESWEMTKPDHARPDRETFRRDDRIRKRVDYQRCYREGSRHFAPLVTVHVHPSPAGGPRLGITATRRVGGSVVRQRLRRRTREIFRRWEGRADLPEVDIVVHLRPAAAEASFEQLRDQIEKLLRRVGSRERERP